MEEQHTTDDYKEEIINLIMGVNNIRTLQWIYNFLKDFLNHWS